MSIKYNYRLIFYPLRYDLPAEKAIHTTLYELTSIPYALPGVQIEEAMRKENWNRIFRQAVAEYDHRRKREPFKALGHYAEEARLGGIPNIYVESLGYLLFMGSLKDAASISNIKFFCDQTRVYVKNPLWQ